MARKGCGEAIALLSLLPGVGRACPKVAKCVWVKLMRVYFWYSAKNFKV